jgi:superfamily I DNA/RNA helicase
MSQILDNLNKAALIGLPHTDVGQRLAASIATDPSSRVALEHTQACVNRFRQYCLERNLLDFSLRIELFHKHLWPVPGVRRFITDRYRYLIADNIEEDTPFAHAILRQWLPATESALLVYDEEAGYRIFLGANWQTAQALQDLCDQTIRLTEPHVASPDILTFGQQLARFIAGPSALPANQTPASEELPTNPASPSLGERESQSDDAQTEGRLAAEIEDGSLTITPHSTDPRRALTFEQKRFYPQMLDWVIDRIAALIEEGVSPGEIVVLAPFVSDALRFSFTHRMAQR